MWTAQIRSGDEGYDQKRFIIERRYGGKMRSGDIVLLHWVPRLERALDFAIKEGEKEGLKPGNLTSYLK